MNKHDEIIFKIKDIPGVSYRCYLRKGKYFNGRPAWELLQVRTHEPIAVATVNLPDVDMADDEIAIKDYSENAGMLDALREAGLVGETVRRVSSGLVSIPIVKVL